MLITFYDVQGLQANTNIVTFDFPNKIKKKNC